MKNNTSANKFVTQLKFFTFGDFKMRFESQIIKTYNNGESENYDF